MRPWIILPLLGSLACKPEEEGMFTGFDDADLTNADVVTALAKNTSAPNMYTLSALFAAALQTDDGICPAATEDGTKTTWTGGCTDDEGYTWTGTAWLDQQSEDAGTITYEDFGRSGMADCTDGGAVAEHQSFDGTVEVAADGSFDALMTGEGTDVDEDACTAEVGTFALDYAGQQVEQTHAVAVWNGSGRFASSVNGLVDAETIDEVVDDEGCASEAESGTTTMSTPDHEVVITYDGAIDCDPESTVTWTLDGVDQGELAGVACTSVPVGAGLGAMFVAIGAAGLRRRRTSGRRVG